MKMTLTEARKTLMNPAASYARQVEAAAAIGTSKSATRADIDLCLSRGGLPAELAAGCAEVPSQANEPSSTGGWIAILEDDNARLAAMQSQIENTYPGAKVFAFDNSSRMIEWLQVNLDRTQLISLDHDLKLEVADGSYKDHGTGREVVEYLVSQSPACPVIVHSSNADAASGMVEELKATAWSVTRVFPHDDLRWIEASWIKTIRGMNWT